MNRYDFSTTRTIDMDGFVHNAEGYAKSCCQLRRICSGNFTDLTGERAMGYYDQDYLNYYYYMASQFALSDRWFSPVASKSVPNRIATFTGGTTQGLVKDPGGDDHLSATQYPHHLPGALDRPAYRGRSTTPRPGVIAAPVSPAPAPDNAAYPATRFLQSSSIPKTFLLPEPSGKPRVPAPTQPSSVVGDTSNSFCIDPNHVAPLSAPITPM